MGTGGSWPFTAAGGICTKTASLHKSWPTEYKAEPMDILLSSVRTISVSSFFNPRQESNAVLAACFRSSIIKAPIYSQGL
jgi:hypothetical protein